MVADVRVLSYNIKELSLDEEAVVEVLRETHADVVALQEATRHPTGRWRMHRLARRAGMTCVVAGGGPCGSFTTALFVRADLAGRVVRASGRPLRWKWWYRRARLAWPTRRGYAVVDLGDVVVVSVHLGLDPRERADHCRQLQTVVDRLGADRCVVVGDLNETPDGPSWAALGPQLRDAALESSAPGAQDATFSVAHPRKRIDAVLVGRDIEVVQVETLRSPAALRGSDHFPVLAELRRH
ncbi:endonuclease/exonuclease/phosphatase family protein [Sanguibacter antarcticus]|nr:endonuclease/exonuclease/phosphatase family protein [Sanguibacter antarcticus]